MQTALLVPGGYDSDTLDRLATEWDRDVPLVTDDEKREALDVRYSHTEACPLCGEVLHPC